MANSIKILSFITCTFLFPAFTLAKDNKKRLESGEIVSHQLMDEKVSELMAGRAVIRKDILLNELMSIDDLILADELAMEELMFPADELYDSNWENKWVNPFTSTKIDYPDSVEIDCSRFVPPTDMFVRVTSKFGPRRSRMHNGIDLKVNTGDTIRSAFDGKVRIKGYDRRGYGNYLVIRHPNGLETVYGHLSKIVVNENDIVRAGEPIGLGGNTGRSTGSHLHFETRILGLAIDPAHIFDFENGISHENKYVFRNVKMNGRKTNIFTASNTHPIYHRVKSGETLGAIARKYGTSVSALCRMNGLKQTSILRIGQSLHVNTVVVSANNNESEVKAVSTQLIASAVTAQQPTRESSEIIYHRITSGDTLGAIAQKYETTVSKLCELNGISRTTLLRLGRRLRCS